MAERYQNLCSACIHRRACEIWANELGETIETGALADGLETVYMTSCPAYCQGSVGLGWVHRVMRGLCIGIGLGWSWLASWGLVQATGEVPSTVWWLGVPLVLYLTLQLW